MLLKGSFRLSRRPSFGVERTCRSLSSPSGYSIEHYIRPSEDFLQQYFDIYVASYNSLNLKDNMKRDDLYSRHTTRLLSKFATVHAYVAEDKLTKELIAGTLLLEIRTNEDFELLKEEVGIDVHNSMRQSLHKYPDWKQLGLYFQKGSFKTTKNPVSELYQRTFLGPPGIHMYSTIPSIHAKNKSMHSHTPICSDMILGKEYTFYEFFIPT